MKQLICLLFAVLILPVVSNAQQFEKALGLRGGLSSGFEYRVFSDDTNSYKLLLSTRDRGIQLTALKEFHRYGLFDFSEQLTLVYGLGLHGGYERWDHRHFYENTSWYETRTAFIAGLDALAGVEYTFYEFPVSVGFEAKPFFDVWGREIFDIHLFDFGFTLKYLF